MPTVQRAFRLLLVEDDPGRINVIESWLPQDTRVVKATSTGRALGILERDRGRVYAGIMLDYNLEKQAATEADKSLTGAHVLAAVIRNVSNDVPVLIHSVNTVQTQPMAAALEKAGFWVSRIPMTDLSKEKLLDWLQEVRDIWEELELEEE